MKRRVLFTKIAKKEILHGVITERLWRSKKCPRTEDQQAMITIKFKESNMKKSLSILLLVATAWLCGNASKETATAPYNMAWITFARNQRIL